MSNLKGFLKPAYTEKFIEVEVSDKFLDDEGNPLKFKLKSIPLSLINSLQKRSIKTKKVNGKTIEDPDADEFLDRCLVESSVQPDFKDPELCHAYGTEDPIAVISKMLSFGERDKLGKAFMAVNDMSQEDFSSIGEITKN